MSTSHVLGSLSALALAAAAFAQPANDNCANAIAVTAGSSTAYDTTTATTDGSSSCGGGQVDVWYTFTATSAGTLTASLCGASYDTVLSILNGSCAGAELGCNDDSCGLSSSVSVSLNNGQVAVIRVAGYFGAVGSSNLQIAFEGAGAVDWTETGDAGDLPSTAQVPSGSGSLSTIQGGIGSGERADMYKFTICDFNSFSATTASTITGAQDTQLFLFNSAGVGVQMDDDDPTGAHGLNSFMNNAYVTANGDYYIAISHWDNDPTNASGNEIWADTPYNVVRAPDGANAGGDFVPTAWNGTSATVFSYRITMTGACFASGGCSADFNGDDIVDFFDYLDFVDAFSANDPSADFNNDDVIDFFDYLDFVDAFASGC